MFDLPWIAEIAHQSFNNNEACIGCEKIKIYDNVMNKVLQMFFLLFFLAFSVLLLILALDDIYYFFKNDKLQNEYNLPYGLKFDYWGYDISSDNYGLVVVDSTDALVLYSGKSILGGGRIQKIYEYFYSDNFLVFKISTDKARQQFVSIDENIRVREIDLREITDVQCTSIKSFDSNNELMNWVKFNIGYRVNFVFLIIGLGILLGIDTLLIQRFFKGLKLK
ncbi:hypothetical protein [Sphingobacterium sp. LRF_L2]|uniref:hypothetical protein n=1 Tax=Sphingobacterium sp. LRF_L2 TaxID=3369421 RepID=UPI003F5FE3B7